MQIIMLFSKIVYDKILMGVRVLKKYFKTMKLRDELRKIGFKVKLEHCGKAVKVR